MKPPTPPNYSYRIVNAQGSILHREHFTTEAEAFAFANALRDRDATAHDAEVLRVEELHRGHREALKRGGEWLTAHLVREGKSRDEIRAIQAEWAKKGAAGPRPWVATFGKYNFHPNTGQCLRFARLRFQAASEDDAFDLLWDAFGDDNWWHAHEIDEVRRMMRDMGQTAEEDLWAPPYFKVAWPTPPTPPGETVTLRVRVTEAQAKERDLWIAGRCLLYRPAPKYEVDFGLGVSMENGGRPECWWHHPEPLLGGAGSVLLVKYVRKPEAERVAAADPENISIVPDSNTFATYRFPEKVLKGEKKPSKNRVVLTGIFGVEAFNAIAEADESLGPVRSEVWESLETMGNEEEKRVTGIEIIENRLVGIYVNPKA